VVVASGFSQRMWAPAAAACSTSVRCLEFSEQITTASGAPRESLLIAVEIGHTALISKFLTARSFVERRRSVRVARDKLDVIATFEISEVSNSMAVGKR